MTRRKLYYVPGMISLIILPLILLSYSSQWRQKEDWRVVEINYFDHKPPQRNYLDLRLTGNPSLDKTIIDYSRLRIQEILSSKDTLNGIHFVFGKQAKYSSFVKIFNNMLLDEKPYYTNSGNEMWVFHVNEVSASKMEHGMPLSSVTSLSL
jgi:hypothetical protein